MNTTANTCRTVLSDGSTCPNKPEPHGALCRGCIVWKINFSLDPSTRTPAMRYVGYAKTFCRVLVSGTGAECGAKTHARYMCAMHAQRYRSHGDPLFTARPAPVDAQPLTKAEADALGSVAPLELRESQGKMRSSKPGRRVKDRSGQQYGKWTVVRQVPGKGDGVTLWLASCTDVQQAGGAAYRVFTASQLNSYRSRARSRAS